MPNWCNNTLKVTGEETELKRFIDAVKTDKQVLSFDKLVPMPKELENTKSPGDNPSWYEWRIANWGTKWDLDESIGLTVKKRVAWYSFDTAWGPPIEWMKAVSVLFSELKFVLRYEEPGVGFKGKAVAENGRVEDICNGHRVITFRPLQIS